MALGSLLSRACARVQVAGQCAAAKPLNSCWLLKNLCTFVGLIGGDTCVPVCEANLVWNVLPCSGLCPSFSSCVSVCLFVNPCVCVCPYLTVFVHTCVWVCAVLAVCWVYSCQHSIVISWSITDELLMQSLWCLTVGAVWTFMEVYCQHQWFLPEVNLSESTTQNGHLEKRCGWTLELSIEILLC